MYKIKVIFRRTLTWRNNHSYYCGFLALRLRADHHHRNCVVRRHWQFWKWQNDVDVTWSPALLAGLCNVVAGKTTPFSRKAPHYLRAKIVVVWPNDRRSFSHCAKNSDSVFSFFMLMMVWRNSAICSGVAWENLEYKARVMFSNPKLAKHKFV